MHCKIVLFSANICTNISVFLEIKSSIAWISGEIMAAYVNIILLILGITPSFVIYFKFSTFSDVFMIKKEMNLFIVGIIIAVIAYVLLQTLIWVAVNAIDDIFIIQMCISQSGVWIAFFFCLSQTYWVIKQLIKIYHIRRPNVSNNTSFIEKLTLVNHMKVCSLFSFYVSTFYNFD